MCMALIYLITVSNSVSEVVILYDAATDAAAIAGSGGDGGMSEDIHAGKPRNTILRYELLAGDPSTPTCTLKEPPERGASSGPIINLSCFFGKCRL
jgi:hypothetical protein